MRNDLQFALSNAMEQSSSEGAIRDVKSLIAREMSDLDPGLLVNSTEHFNHSFFPDFIVSWRENGTEEHRDVFLRYDAASVLYQDGRRIESGDQVFLGIESRQADPAIREGLANAMHGESDCLVSDAASLDNIRTPEWSNTASVLPRVTANAWIRGARGLLDETDVRLLKQEVAEGESAMIEGAAERAGYTVDAVRRNFRRDYARRIERVMQFMWLSAGNALNLFPGRHALSTRLSESEIRWLIPFLLQYARVDDEFWRLVGEAIDLRLLQSLGDLGESPNLDRLVTVNLDRLLAVQVMLRRRNTSLHPGLNEPHWTVRNGVLTLGAEGFDCLVVDDKRKLANSRPVPWPTNVGDIDPRLERYQLQEIAFSSPAATVDVKSTTPFGLHDSRAYDYSSTLGGASGLSKLSVRPTGSDLDVLLNFLKGTAEIEERRSRIQTLIFTAVDLIYQADASLLQMLRDFLELPER